MKRAVVIGSGFGGISAAAFLARDGFDVTVLEKNAWVGGRARSLEEQGYRFDMGPSWYWMPEEHDRWFTQFGVRREDYYRIHRVDPAYRAYFGESTPGETETVVDMPADITEARKVFERYQAGGAGNLDRYLADCRRKYEFAMGEFIYKNFYSITDFINGAAIRNLPLLNITRSYGGRVKQFFRHPYLRKMLEFPVVFLGSDPRSTPAMYTLMNHIDFNLGTWYPDGGFTTVVKAMQQVAEGNGARFLFGHEVTATTITNASVRSVVARTDAGEEVSFPADVVVANADYPWVETHLLPEEYRSIAPPRWDRAKLAPAVLNFYLGFDRKLDEFAHHTFFFDADWDDHFDAVYTNPRWIDRPLFYLHVPSRTDRSCAPETGEAVFLLVPIAPGLEDTPERRAYYLEHALDRIRDRTGKDLRENLVYKAEMSINDFVRDYNAYKGNGFGLGHTLFQTAWFRIPNKSKKLRNLYYAGQFTVPGTGTTMSMISGEVAAMRIRKEGAA